MILVYFLAGVTIHFDNLRIDYAAAYKRSRSVVSRQTKRVAFLMKNNGIAVYDGTGTLKSDHEVAIEQSGQTISGKHIIVATGAKTRPLPGAPYDGQKIINISNCCLFPLKCKE